LVSLLGGKKPFNLDRLLHRGSYAIEGEMTIVSTKPSRGWKILGMGREFTAGDKFIYVMTYAWIGVWTVIFLAGTVYNLTHDVSDTAWLGYWKIYVLIYALVSALVMIWFTIGGVKDMRKMFRQLAVMGRDDGDDGFVTRDKDKG
jgi:SSS family solute:Na+ symporter